MDPIESVSSFERFLLRVLERRGSRAFVWVVTLLSIAMSQVVTYVTLVLTRAPAEDILIGAGVALVVPAVMASVTAGVLARLLTSLRAATDQLHHLSRTDPLTGLHNRRAFLADAEVLRCAAASSVLVVAMVDIDHFKRFNDGHGHADGDQLLCTLAANLRAAVGHCGVVGRLGGDEFAVALLLPPEADVTEATARLEDACDLHVVEARQFASIGLFVGPASTALDVALADADRSLYDGKHHVRRDRADGRRPGPQHDAVPAKR